MKLFHCPQAPVGVVDGPTAIETPLGIVQFLVFMNDAVTNFVPTQTYGLTGGGGVVSWQHDTLDLELLVAQPFFSSPLELPVENCWGMLWRGQSKAYVASLVLTAV